MSELETYECHFCGKEDTGCLADKGVRGWTNFGSYYIAEDMSVNGLFCEECAQLVYDVGYGNEDAMAMMKLYFL